MYLRTAEGLSVWGSRHLDPGLLLCDVLAHTLQLARNAGALLRDNVGARQLLQQLRLQRRLRLPVPLLLWQPWPPVRDGMGPLLVSMQTVLMPQEMASTERILDASEYALTLASAFSAIFCYYLQQQQWRSGST